MVDLLIAVDAGAATLSTAQLAQGAAFGRGELALEFGRRCCWDVGRSATASRTDRLDRGLTAAAACAGVDARLHKHVRLGHRRGNAPAPTALHRSGRNSTVEFRSNRLQAATCTGSGTVGTRKTAADAPRPSPGGSSQGTLRWV